jgi:hypothetical protein
VQRDGHDRPCDAELSLCVIHSFPGIDIGPASIVTDQHDEPSNGGVDAHGAGTVGTSVCVAVLAVTSLTPTT